GIGGVRGLSHLGVMKYLEENNYQIKSVLDSSIGSPVALFDQLKKAPRFKEISSWIMYNVSNKAFDTMQSTIAIQKIAAYPLDIEIIIARNVCGTYDFDRSQEMIDLSYQKTLETVISH
ncbi:MAG: hypothetical protein ACKVJP_05870, partial [Flavobacteriales bacterium]